LSLEIFFNQISVVKERKQPVLSCAERIRLCLVALDGANVPFVPLTKRSDTTCMPLAFFHFFIGHELYPNKSPQYPLTKMIKIIKGKIQVM